MLTRQSSHRWTRPHGTHRAKSTDGALSHITPADPWRMPHITERIVTHTQRSNRKPSPNSTTGACTVPETIAHERPPRRRLGLTLLSSRRARGELRHIQRLLAAVEVEDDVVLGGRAPFGTCGGRGGTPRPAPTPPTRGRQRESREEHAARRTASTTNAADRRSSPHTIVNISMRRCL